MTIEKGPKFEKKEKEKEPIVDVEVDEKIEKEIFEKYENLEFLIESVGMEYEELIEEEIEEEFEQRPQEAGIPLEPESLFYEIEIDPEDFEDVSKITLKKVFEKIGFDPNNPEIIKETKEGVSGKEKDVKYFKIKDPNLDLSFDGIFWALSKK